MRRPGVVDAAPVVSGSRRRSGIAGAARAGRWIGSLLAMGSVVILAACSSSDRGENMVDLNAAAARAEGDIADYAALQSAGHRASENVASAVASPVVSDPSERSAVEIVTLYYAHLSARRYAEARALRRGGGKASGLTDEAFAAGFARYDRYQAVVGMPRDADAGAGQRYITVPVVVAGTLAGGGTVQERLAVVLHRAAEGIEAADPAAHLWRIERISPDVQPAIGPASATAHYRCGGGFAFVAHFDNRADSVTLRMQRRSIATLVGQRPASGIWYAGMGFTLRGKGVRADLTRPDGSVLQCTAAE